MPYRQDCAACGSALTIADFVTAPWLTCPRCLAKVMNPGSVGGAAQDCPQCSRKNSPKARRCIYCGVDLGGSPVTVPAVDRIPCRFCGGEVKIQARLCPHCREWLDDVDLSVDRDVGFVGRMMLPMAAIGAAGIALIVMSQDIGAAGGFLALGFLVLVGFAFFLHRARENPAAAGVARIVLGGLAIAGVLVALSLIALFAFIVYLFVVCMGGGLKI